MIRFFVSAYISFAIVGWVLEETKILLPATGPFVESFVEFASIPTHDEWDPELIEATKSAFIGTGKSIARKVLTEERHEEEDLEQQELALLIERF